MFPELSEVSKLTHGQVIAIARKTLRRSHQPRLEKATIWMVSALGDDESSSLGPSQGQKQSNEIKAIPELLRVLELNDCIVTIEALSCQARIPGKITENHKLTAWHS